MSSRLGIAGIVLLAAFGLAACGGGGGGTATEPEPTGPTQAELEAAEQRAAEEKAKREAAEKKLTEAEAAANKARMEGLFTAIMKNVDGTAITETGDPSDGVAAIDPKAAVPPTDSRVMHDKGSATTMAFAKYYTARLTAGSDVLQLTDATNGPEPGAASDKFPKNGGSSTYTDADAATDLPATVSLPGTLMGARGTFDCTGADCTISEDGGTYTFSNAWTFDPDAGTTVTIEDKDYNRWGWWAFKRKDGTYRVETFAAAIGTTDDIASAPSNLSSLGTATYTGSAAGKYAIDNRPTGDTLEAGHFEASATITADFDDGTAGTVSGAIDGFMVDGVEKDWSVSLGKTDIVWSNAATANDIDTSNDTADSAAGIAVGGEKNEWTMGGVKGAADGDWSGDFHHDGDPRKDGTPATVIGEFTASHGSTAYMTGAFGAGNKAADTPGN